jgi:hypothetical protein
MRHTELWARLDHHLGPAYSRTWATQQVLGALGHRTPQQALDAGVSPKQVWAAVWEALDLPASER